MKSESKEEFTDPYATIKMLQQELAESNKGMIALALELENKAAELVRVNSELADDILKRKKIEKEREQLNAELIRKNRELEQIVYVTSHDLRSPLLNVQGFSKELTLSLQELAAICESEEIPDNIRFKFKPFLHEDIPETLHYIRTSIIKMDSLLSGLLQLSRLGRIVLNIERLNMNVVITDVVEAFGFTIQRLGVIIDIQDLPPCAGDSSQINQVFSNLLDNALKHLHPDRPGIIKITAYKQEGLSTYCVEDNGFGISDEYQDQIFEIFHQLDPDTTSGEGLGLAIVKRILERHDGKVWVVSELNKGSKFYVSLPTLTLLSSYKVK